MTDSFFGFDTTLEGEGMDEGMLSEEDEEGYDALNDETFGEGVLTDWEEDHEKMAELTELSRHVISEDGRIIADLVDQIMDYDFMSKPDDHIEPPLKPKTRPPPGFSNSGDLDVKLNLPSLKKVCTVEEIERNLIKPTNSLRLEDLERNLIKPNPTLLGPRPGPGFLNLLPRHPLLGNQLLKMPPLVPLQVNSQLPPHPFLMQNSMGPGGVPLMRLPHLIGARGAMPINLPRVPHPNEDEYAGLMTPKEKQWLASIQLLQLNSINPYQDDFYFSMYQVRQSGNHGRKIGSSLKNSRDPPSLIKPTYTPLQFENSLGKLQVGSVMAPRKIIDTDIVESVECSTSHTSSKKLKQILIEIEHMYSSVLLAEDALSPLNSSAEINVNPGEIFQKIVVSLVKGDKLLSFLNVRKGKTLILRILPHTEVSGPLAHKLITVLPSATKKDPEQALLRALPAIRHYLNTCTLQTLLDLSASLKPHIDTLLPNKFGVSVLANMIERAEFLHSQGQPEESNAWLEFISQILSQCQVERPERPVVGIHGPSLAKHLSRCTTANNQDVAILQKALSNSSTADKL